MRSTLTRDLASWEQGALSTAELELRHPGRAVGLVALYKRLSDLGDGPVPDGEADWDRLRNRLPEHPVAVAVRASANPYRLKRLVARPLALAAAVAMFGAAIGYALAPEAVNRQLASFWDRVTDFFGDEPSENWPTPLVEVEPPVVLVEVDEPGVVPSDYVKDEGDVGRHRSGEDEDRRGGHDDERRASDEGSHEGSDTDRGSDDDSSGSSNIAGGSSDISGGDAGGSDDGSGGSGSGSDRSGSSDSGSDRSGNGSDGSGGSSGDDDGYSGDDDGSGGDDDGSSGDDDGSGGDDDGGDG